MQTGAFLGLILRAGEGDNRGGPEKGGGAMVGVPRKESLCRGLPGGRGGFEILGGENKTQIWGPLGGGGE